MNDGTIDVFFAASNVISGRGTPEDAAAVIRALARGAQLANELAEIRLDMRSARQHAAEVRTQLDHERDQRRNDRSACRTSLGDGCVTLRCGARMLIENGYPKRIHDGDPHAQFREERRAIAIEQASAVWGERLEIVGAWGENGEAELDLEIPF